MNTIEFGHREWFYRMEGQGWRLPPKPHWFIRLPIIRHLWVVRQAYLVGRWYSHGIGMFGIRSGFDDWVIYGMWHNLWPSDEVTK